MLYAIYAYEETYGGLHGMNTSFVVECASLDEAEEIGLAESLNVMESYASIMDLIYEDASQEYETETDDWWELVEDIKREQSAYEIFEIKNSKGKSIEELEYEFYNDKESFVKNYCS